MHIVKSSLLAVGLLAALALSACTNNGGTVNVPGDAVDAGDMASGDMEITGFDLPWDEESVQGECETNQDCDGKFAEMDVCQIALCDSVQKVCVLGSKKDYTPCDDGNACVLDTYCLDGVCGNGFDLLCTDSNPCTDDSCDPVSGCAFENNAAACDDGNQCTTDDTCSGGQCVGNPGGCPCTTDEECQPLVQNLCSYDEMACEEGFCVVSQSLEVVCDDSMDSDCQLNLCDPETGACEMTFIVGPCSDGSTCTVGDTCQDGVCVPGQSMCECATDADCAEFDDANLCNGVLVCAEAQCVVQAGSVVTCSQEGLGFCQMSKCNPATGNCETLSKANGITCDDGDDCTDADACLNGACVGQALACDDGDPCTADVCGEDRGCEHLPLSDVPCDDGDECTDGDMCFEGLCQPGQFTCGECGDGLCEGPETCALCPEDCGECGSDCCEVQEGPGCEDEAVQTCVCDLDSYCCETQWDDICIEEAVAECGLVCEVNPCGDGVCDGPETCELCPEDCGPCPGCGDGVCDEVETCELCPEDCGECGECGDGVCGEAESCELCPEDCGECGGTGCCEPHDTPGCDDAEVMACVCELDAFCCESAWDDLCVAEVNEFECGDCGGEPVCGDGICNGEEDCELCPDDCGVCPGACCEPQEVPGCDDAEIMACVCALDEFCCDVVWDDLCVAEVEEFQCGDCGGVGGCGNGLCEEPETCFTCPDDCGECAQCGDGVCDDIESCEKCPSDCGECPWCGDGVCDEDEDCKACAADCGDCCGNGACEALFGEDCTTCAADCGDCPASCGDGNCDEDETCVNCVADCGECEGSCCVANGTQGCMDATVQACVCAFDAFCCTVEWDAICAAEADECGSCTGDCCASHQNPGCDDEEIEECVCALDSFCCDVFWDNLCAQEVEQFDCGTCEVPVVCGDDLCDIGEDCKSCPADCGDCCGNDMCEALLGEDCTTCPEDCGECPLTCGDGACGEGESCVNCMADCGACEGSCCIANGTPGCTNANVQGCVCAMDPYCCNVQWDSLCAAEADECGSCSGDCCQANGTVGCDDETIEACVCAIDPYCCNVNWDNLCAQEVESQNCGSCAAPDVCGDGICGETESCVSCPGDCGQCASTCCEPHDGTGCDDADCVDYICLIDPFCCETQWDEICANEAVEFCPSCGGAFPECGDGECNGNETCETCPGDCGECPPECGDGECNGEETCESCEADCGSCPGEGSCCLANGSVGCNDDDVEACVCAMDSFCCETEWDSICAAEADECDACNGNCCEANGTTGCDNEEIEACVCAQDPFCCNVDWDSVCADEVTDLGCGECIVVPECGDGECNGEETCETCEADCGSCPGEGSCCLANGSIGCDDKDVEACVCAMDPYCCETQWDSLCAAEADECGACNGNCCEANGTTGCDNEEIEACVCAQDPYCCNVDWDSICADEVTDLGCGECGVLPECGDGECNGDEDCASCPVDCGECPPECGDGECNGEEDCESCPEDCGECQADDCCVANGTPECEDAQCTNVVCGMDPFCCDVQWDDICAEQANEYCPVCGGTLPGGDCCEAHDETGCQVDECEAIVCAADPWCCNNSWDGICANEALEWCAVCGGVAPAVCGDGECNGVEDCQSCPEDCGECPPECGDGECNGEEDCESCPEDCGECQTGDCCVANGTPECEDTQCTIVVCDMDSFCCDVQWDGICANEANEYCPVCGGTLPGGNCCEAHAETGCQVAECQELVCAADSFCCDNNWDNICANEALEWCSVCGGTNPAVCGDGECNGVEDCESCPGDCGECPPECGDGECNGDEDCDGCPEDCGACCGNGACDFGETCDSCEVDCGACPSDCCEANGTPECDDAQCTNVVCDMDPFCCDVQWDDICADEANTYCPVCDGTLPGGNCCEAHGEPGCQIAECQEIVCAADSFCCNNNWDGICASEALEWCAVCGGVAPDFCGDGQCNGDESCDSCADDCGACCGNGACDFGETCDSCEADCGACCGNGQCDFGETCDSCEVDCGACCGNGQCDFGETCDSCEADCGACCGNGACDFGETCNTCEADCGACAGDCCAANGTPGCELSACQAEVCAVDPFCCDVAWDNICGNEALDMCVGCQDIGNCCTTGHGAGCENAEIQNCVCAIDPYCCNNTWDNLCVGEAESDCGGDCGLATFCGDGQCNGDENCNSCEADCGACCGNGACDNGETCATCQADCGSCCGNGACDNGEDCNTCAQDCGACGSNCCQSGHGAGCDDGTCQAIVCAVDPFCCDTNWDGICVSEAEDMCPVCGGSIPGGNCCTTGHGAGCNVVAIQSCVCAIDPFCCDVNWDGICVNEAQADCGASCN